MRTRITRRAEEKEEMEEKADQNTIVAEQLVKLAKTLLAQDEAEAVEGSEEEDPKFNAIRQSIRQKLTKFNKKGILQKRLQSVKGIETGNQLVSRMKVIEVFELVDNLLSI